MVRTSERRASRNIREASNTADRIASFTVGEKQAIVRFRRKVREYYRRHGRRFPWRETTDPWAILVSEVMLQQTQTGRVAEQFPIFMRAFPTPVRLARASLPRVLQLWQGMGYNRRAKHLWNAARELRTQFNSVVPSDPETLRSLPGIGPYTAGAIAAFAFNQRTVFLETNIRAALIAEFFPGRHGVPDDELLPYAAAVLPTTNVAAWYQAFMDYGAWIKRTHPGITSRAGAYVRQSPFHGSVRQLRGRLLKTVLARTEVSIRELGLLAPERPAQLREALEGLIRDQMIERSGTIFRVARG